MERTLVDCLSDQFVFRRDVVKLSLMPCKELAPQAGGIIGYLSLQGCDSAHSF